MGMLSSSTSTSCTGAMSAGRPSLVLNARDLVAFFVHEGEPVPADACCLFELVLAKSGLDRRSRILDVMGSSSSSCAWVTIWMLVSPLLQGHFLLRRSTMASKHEEAISKRVPTPTPTPMPTPNATLSSFPLLLFSRSDRKSWSKSLSDSAKGLMGTNMISCPLTLQPVYLLMSSCERLYTFGSNTSTFCNRKAVVDAPSCQ
mmetsp:Transcript_23366/g.64581  ORF Transcript_23366/g.64581 Transcript_23366/m.64581 type:complete len:202 (-) Transcript_23366:1361-1966(-)